jgi:hypothetical protein
MQGGSSSSKDVNFELLKAFYTEQLHDYFASMLGAKSVIAEEHLHRLVRYLLPKVPPSVSEIVPMQANESFKPKSDQVVFVVAPTFKAMEMVKQHVERFGDVDVRILFIPRKTDECIELLVDKYNICTADRIHEINIYLVPWQTNFLSLEMPDSFTQYVNSDDFTYMVYVKESIKKLE